MLAALAMGWSAPGATAQSADAPPEAADTALVRAWIRQHAVPLATVRPGASLADLEPLRRIVGDARLVALGEGTHGSREFFQLKHRMLEFLATEMGFTAFAIEASLPEAMDVDRYVRTGEGDPARALAGMYFWTWDTEEVLALIRWMRDYNRTKSPDQQLGFHGFDMQFTARAGRTVRDFLRRVDPAAGRSAEPVLGLLADPFRSREFLARAPEDRKQAVTDSLGRVVADFHRRMDAYARSTSAEETSLVRRHLDILLQALGAGGRSRDVAMAANLAWLLGREGPRARVVLWAHNQHVAVREGSQGEALRQRFGSDLRVFGFAFDRGGFQARDVLVDGALRPWSVESAPDTTVEAQLREAAPPLALLDLGALPDSGPVATWFRTPRAMRSIGSGYTDAHPEWYWWTAPVAGTYDALVFVEQTTPARATLTGRRPAAAPPPTPPANLDFELGLPGAWPPGWAGPPGAAVLEWDVRLTSAEARSGKQAVVLRRAPGPRYGETYTSLSQRSEASPWRGQRIALRAWARVIGDPEGRGYFWLEVTEPGDPYDRSVLYRSTTDRPVTGPEWRLHELEADVSAAANILSFGFAFVGDGDGDGEAWLDGVTLEALGPTGGPRSDE